jgi:hypothetical protein
MSARPPTSAARKTIRRIDDVIPLPGADYQQSAANRRRAAINYF